VEAPLTVVQIHGSLLWHITDEVVTNASTIVGRGSGSFVESFGARMVPALVFPNALGTTLMRPSLQFATCAFESLRHWPLNLHSVHWSTSLQQIAQPFCKEDCIRVDLDSPVIAAVGTNTHHFSPESVENTRVHCCAPPATKSYCQ